VSENTFITSFIYDHDATRAVAEAMYVYADYVGTARGIVYGTIKGSLFDIEEFYRPMLDACRNAAKGVGYDLYIDLVLVGNIDEEGVVQSDVISVLD